MPHPPGRAEKRRLEHSSIGNAVYYRSNFTDPAFEIKVPRLTRKERIYLDREMPCQDDWMPAEIDLDPEVVKHYREIYRFLPAFAELAL